MKFIDMWHGEDRPIEYNGETIVSKPDIQPCYECKALTYFYAFVIARRLCSTECVDRHLQGLIDGEREVNYGE